ncbi:hypothetical protein ACOSQ2_009409 [Xanthoceras sorbifolium]
MVLQFCGRLCDFAELFMVQELQMAYSSSSGSQPTNNNMSSSTRQVEFASISKAQLQFSVKLTQDNYIHWKAQILSAIRALELEEHQRRLLWYRSYKWLTVQAQVLNQLTTYHLLQGKLSLHQSRRLNFNFL